MNRFEQLIEYVINDEDAKARELFHDIVVAKSREIYENIMAEEDDELDEEQIDVSNDMGAASGAVGEAYGGDAADDMIDEIESDEEADLSMEGEEEEIDIDADIDADTSDDMGDMGDDDMDNDEDLEDRVMDLEDKLDELMSEFESLMGDEDSMSDGDDFGAGEGGDAIEMDDTEEMMPMAEAISLKAAPKPVTSEEPGINKKSINNNNSGQTGMAASPVKMTGDTAQGRPAPTTKDLIGDFQNKAGGSMKDQKAAPKPVTAQASGVNTKTPFPKG
jgi:hypothetical protein